MTGYNPDKTTRRSFLALAGAGGATLAVAGPSAAAESAENAESLAAEKAAAISDRLPFFGQHQAGIVTAPQKHAYFVAFDVASDKRAGLTALMRAWSDAAARLCDGGTPLAAAGGDYSSDPDPAELQGLSPSRLTITFGFGPSLFVKDGKDRFGLAAQRPEAFVDLPNFPGDQFEPARSGGDLFAQVCADNQQVAFHAVRALGRLAYGAAQIRWIQTGFVSDYGAGKTARNLMGFKDGTDNPQSDDAGEMDKIVWAGDEAPAWMRGGSYLVFRRTRMALEHWERTQVAFQEQTFGRHKLSGAPLGGKTETDPVDLKALDKDGNPIIPENSHVGIARRFAEAGARILRRSYSYNDGANMTAERWPPWRQGMEFDAGLVFVCFQRDLRKGFIPIFERMSRFDMLNQFVTNTGGAHFACPGGAAPGDYVGRALLEA